MTFAYGGDPAASDKDAVRFLLGDVDSAEPLVTDEEILYALDKWADLYGTNEWTAATLADTIASRYAREASISADGVNVSLGIVAQQFRELAASLRQQHKNLLVGGSPDAGGISLYEQADPANAPLAFGTQMHDDPEAGRQDYGSRDLPFPYEYYPGV